MDNSKIRIAIDGPSGAGKSSVAKAVADMTGLIYVDTGSLYRTVGLYMAERGIGAYDTAKIIAALPDVDIRLAHEGGHQHVYLCGTDVGERIRTEEASYYASAVSKIPEVRSFLLDIQHTLAKAGGVIMDGRDIGTVIIPDAEIKIFMTASPEERAMRRFREQKQKGISATYEEILENIIARDRQDTTRETAPLKPAPDAVVFVNDGYDVARSAEYVAGLIREYTLSHEIEG